MLLREDSLPNAGLELHFFVCFFFLTLLAQCLGK